MLSLFELLAALLTVTAAFAWLNSRVLRLPSNIGLLMMGLGASLVLLSIDFLFPGAAIYKAVTETLQQIDFYDAVMHGMLAFMLFAAALNVDLARLRGRAPVVAILATVGVVVSSLVIAAGMWLAARAMDFPLSFPWALVFGALIAPTDPVAVIATLKSMAVPEKLETDMSGEALFNDGVAVVLFTITLKMATGMEPDTGPLDVLRLFLLEAGAGALLGLVTGFVTYRALRAIDDYSVEVMISLALVTGTYALADALQMSGPIAVVVAGVLIGSRGRDLAMSDRTKKYVFAFWTLVDDILNAILFMLIGLEVLVVRFEPAFAWIGVIAIPLTLLARTVAVGVPVTLLGRWQGFAPGTAPVLVWGGVRGGISVALALSVPASQARELILVATYAVVLFTIIAQGLSLEWVIRKTALRREDEGQSSSDIPFAGGGEQPQARTQCGTAPGANG